MAPMSEMTDDDLRHNRDYFLGRYNRNTGDNSDLILANQYDAELTRRREGKTNPRNAARVFGAQVSH